MWGWKKSRAAQDPLDEPLFNWNKHDAFRVRDLLNGGCLIVGRAGSGKTSSSGRTLMQAIVDNPMSAGLLLSAKPEDAGDIERVFHKAGRLRDLIVFDERSDRRCNFFGCLKHPRDVVQFIKTLSDATKRSDGKGGDNSRFYEQQEDRTNYNAVAALQAAGEPITGANLHRFIMTAATRPEDLTSPQWLATYHNKVLERGYHTPKTPSREHDFTLCLDFWAREWPTLMDPKTRGNVLAGVQGVMHTMNTGLVREMVCGGTNCSPGDILAGKWINVNFAPSSWGLPGLVISLGWKQLVEQAILERKAGDGSPFCVVWADESPQFLTEFDASSFIPQCRSHKGCLVYLGQAVSSYYAAMKGDTGRHMVDALLANFSHVVVHVSDPVTAKWASAKLGRRKEVLYSGSSSPSADWTAWDGVFGNTRTSASFSEHYEAVLQDQEFMVGRTGGPANNYLVDAVVIKSGESFSDSNSYRRVVFSQR